MFIRSKSADQASDRICKHLIVTMNELNKREKFDDFMEGFLKFVNFKENEQRLKIFIFRYFLNVKKL